MAAFCASSDVCAKSQTCNIAYILTDNYELSAQGVAQCWLELCAGKVSGINQDFAGAGVCKHLSHRTARLVLTRAATFIDYPIIPHPDCFLSTWLPHFSHPDFPSLPPTALKEECSHG
jgi:hypothetical protein